MNLGLTKEKYTLSTSPERKEGYFFFLLVTSAMIATTAVNAVAKKMPN